MGMPPIYQPDIVVNAIAYAVEHPVRDISASKIHRRDAGYGERGQCRDLQAHGLPGGRAGQAGYDHHLVHGSSQYSRTLKESYEIGATVVYGFGWHDCWYRQPVRISG